MDLPILDTSDKDHYLSPEDTHIYIKSQNIIREEELKHVLDLKYNEAGKAVKADKEVDKKNKYVVVLCIFKEEDWG